MSEGTVTIDLVVPRLGETMEEGVVRDWLVAVGDGFERGDPILEIETDKTIAEVPALAAGRLVEILIEPGTTLAVGTPLGRIEIAASDAPADAREPSAKGEGEDPAPPPVGGGLASAPPPAADAAADIAVPVDDTGLANDRPVRATPAARRAARRHGIRVRDVAGSGRRGRVETADVEAVAADAGAADGRASNAGRRRGAYSEKGAGPALDVVFAGDIAHVVAGPANGTPSLLLHGFAADHTVWAATTHALARAGRRVVVPDLPGHGATRRDAPDVDALDAGLADFVAEVIGHAPPHVVAHSLGAAPALALAAAVPVASLTLIAPAGMGLGIDATFVRAMASPGSVGELSHLLRRLTVRPAGLSSAAVRALHVELCRGRLSGLADSLLGAAGQTLDLVTAIERAARQMPVRVIVGHRDRIIDWQDVFALTSRVAVHHLVDAGHMPQWDSPREVLELLLEGEGT